MKRIAWVLLAWIPALLWAQEGLDLTQGLSYRLEAQGTAGDGDNNPLWLNANKYGLSSLETANGYVRAGAFRDLQADSARRWGVGFGMDVAVAANFTSTLVLQQAYAEVRWLKARLTLGAKEQPMEMVDNELSSGALTLGRNARPAPGIRGDLDWWNIPLTKGWLSIKGHIFYGNATDNSWQKEFTNETPKFTQDWLIHTKAGYLRIGRVDKGKLTAIIGLETATQFGGTSYLRNNGGSLRVVKHRNNLSSYWHAFTGGGAEVTETNGLTNAEGNLLGNTLMRLDWREKDWQAGLYMMHPFEDGSGLTLRKYDGYGTGDNRDVHEKRKYKIYELKDMLLGAEWKLNRKGIIDHVVAEYLYTKYQSGPVHLERSATVIGHVGGCDNYYNHGLQTGWQHWGQALGNPLFRSPIYNTDGKIYFANNRMVAWHLGVGGNPTERLHYRALLSYQKGWGTYQVPFDDPRRNVSLLAEVSYQLPKGWAVKGAAGLDHGSLLGDNAGVQVTIIKTGQIKLK